MTKKPSDTPGQRIAALRKQHGWTQSQLAQDADISVTYLSEVENDKRSMSWDVLLRVANALGTSMDYLAKGASQKTHVEKPILIPPELAQAAEERNWSVGEARDLMRAREIVVARRSKQTRPERLEERLTKSEWIDLYERLFGK